MELEPDCGKPDRFSSCFEVPWWAVWQLSQRMQPVGINRPVNGFNGLCACENIYLKEGKGKPLYSSSWEKWCLLLIDWIVTLKVVVREFSGWKPLLVWHPNRINIKKTCLPALKHGNTGSLWLLPGRCQNPSQTEWVVLSLEVAPGAKGGNFWAPLLSACVGLGTQPYPVPALGQPIPRAELSPGGASGATPGPRAGHRASACPGPEAGFSWCLRQPLTLCSPAEMHSQEPGSGDNRS